MKSTHFSKYKIMYAESVNSEYTLSIDFDDRCRLADLNIDHILENWKFEDLPWSITEHYDYDNHDNTEMLEEFKNHYLLIWYTLENNEVTDLQFNISM